MAVAPVKIESSEYPSIVRKIIDGVARCLDVTRKSKLAYLGSTLLIDIANEEMHATISLDDAGLHVVDRVLNTTNDYEWSGLLASTVTRPSIESLAYAFSPRLHFKWVHAQYSASCAEWKDVRLPGFFVETLWFVLNNVIYLNK